MAGDRFFVRSREDARVPDCLLERQRIGQGDRSSPAASPVVFEGKGVSIDLNRYRVAVQDGRAYLFDHENTRLHTAPRARFIQNAIKG